MKSADLNSDGYIDYSEFILAACTKDFLLSTEHLRDVFNSFVTNNNDFL